MTNEISVSMLFKILKSAWWKILIFTVAIAIIAAALTAFVIPKKYASSTTFYIINSSVSNEYTTTSLLDASAQLANDYIEIIKSDSMLTKISDDLAEKGYKDISTKTIRSMISSQTSDEASTFTVTVTSTDNELAFRIAESIEKNAPEIVKNVSRPSYTTNLYIFKGVGSDNILSADDFVQMSEADLECIKVIRIPELSKSHVSPSLTKNTLLAAIVAAIIAYAFFLVRKLFDTVIRNEETAKNLVDLPIIGKIPTWDVTAQLKDVSEKNVKE